MKKRFFLTALVSLACLLTVSCLDQKPTLIGSNRISVSGVDTATLDTFKFNFAYRAAASNIVYMQGISISKSAIQSTCNIAGTGCTCVFLNSSNQEIESTDSSEIRYDLNGNFLRCEYDGALASLAKVKVRNIQGTEESDVYTIDTTLTARKIIGDLDMNKLRTVYRYYCLQTYLHKYATTATTFTCGDPGANQCVAGSDLCLERAFYPYHLYQDNLTSNFGMKPVDDIYRNQGANDTICNVFQLKRFDCTIDTATQPVFNSVPTKHFGLYAEQTGIFQVAVPLYPGPDLSTDYYGYAARPSTSTGECPPGLEKKRVWAATPVVANFNIAATQSINLTAIPATDVANSTAPGLSNLAFTRYSGGSTCDGVTCTFNFGTQTSLVNYAYAVNTSVEEFCAFPASIL